MNLHFSLQTEGSTDTLQVQTGPGIILADPELRLAMVYLHLPAPWRASRIPGSGIENHKG
jgi:hypothetical protein